LSIGNRVKQFVGLVKVIWLEIYVWSAMWQDRSVGSYFSRQKHEGLTIGQLLKLASRCEWAVRLFCLRVAKHPYDQRPAPPFAAISAVYWYKPVIAKRTIIAAWTMVM